MNYMNIENTPKSSRTPFCRQTIVKEILRKRRKQNEKKSSLLNQIRNAFPVFYSLNSSLSMNKLLSEIYYLDKKKCIYKKIYIYSI